MWRAVRVITPLVRIQVLLFVVISLLGLGYVGVHYVGLGNRLLGRNYTVGLDLAQTAGLFVNAPVTYRGVPIGTVEAVTLADDGVRATLRIDRGVRVPSDLTAVVAHRSAVGEQYVDLRPSRDGEPYLKEGDTIPRERTSLPLPMETLLGNLDALVGSVSAEDLGIVLDELGRAFAGNETALRTLLDATSLLLQDTQTHLPEVLRLIHDGQTVLTTQANSASAIREWAASLAQLTDTLRTSDTDLRRLLAEGPPAAAETIRLLHGLEPSVGVLLGNLVTVGDITVRRLPGIEQLLVVYPTTVAGGFTVAPGDGTAHLGLVVNYGDPPPCVYPSGGPAQCSAQQHASGSGVRAADQAPHAGGPAAVPGPTAAAGTNQTGTDAQAGQAAPAAVAPLVTLAGFDPATGLVLGPDGSPLQFGGTGGQYGFSGDESWKQLLFSGLSA
jgi:phospholipid/cholesterol/gamma-HCH transport system substrate-binding protein